MNNMTNCEKCGKCCYYEIPITLLDIERIADNLNDSYEEVFNYVIQDSVSESSEIYKINKKKDGSCIFLNNDGKCGIHEFRPRTCEFYRCDHLEKDEVMPWTVYYSDDAQKSKIWEQSVAIEFTKEYIWNNGTNWNEEDYKNAINTIKDNIKSEEEENIKLSRNENGDPISQIYNCSACHSRASKIQETPVTLPEIKKISKFLNISLGEFFKDNISNELSKSTDGLKLKRD